MYSGHIGCDVRRLFHISKPCLSSGCRFWQFVALVPMSVLFLGPCKAILACLILLVLQGSHSVLAGSQKLAVTVSLSVLGSQSHWAWVEGTDTQGFAAAAVVGRLDYLPDCEV